MDEKFKVSFNFYSNILILTLFFISAVVYADTNGIWYETSDIRGGTFGSDEQDVTSFYSFINPVNFNSNVYFNDWVGVMTETPTVELEVNGTIKVNTLLADNLVNQRCGTHQAIVGFDENNDIICETIYEYFWRFDGWGTCQGACETTGTQFRTVWCEREDGITVDDEFCENGADDPRPDSSQDCWTGSCTVPASTYTHSNANSAFGCAGSGWRTLRVTPSSSGGVTLSASNLRSDYSWKGSATLDSAGWPRQINYAYGRDNTQLRFTSSGNLEGRCKNYLSWSRLRTNAICPSGYSYNGVDCSPN